MTSWPGSQPCWWISDMWISSTQSPPVHCAVPNYLWQTLCDLTFEAMLSATCIHISCPFRQYLCFNEVWSRETWWSMYMCYSIATCADVCQILRFWKETFISSVKTISTVIPFCVVYEAPLTLTMLAYYMLKSPLKFARPRTAAPHFSGYRNNHDDRAVI